VIASAGFPHFRHERVVDLTRSLSRRTRAQERPITLKPGSLVDRAEGHTPAHMRSDINVRGGEAIARYILGAVELIFERDERLLARAIAAILDCSGRTTTPSALSVFAASIGPAAKNIQR
jgi:hypothetical protein